MLKFLSITILLSFLMAAPVLAKDEEKGFFSNAWQSVQCFFSSVWAEEVDSSILTNLPPDPGAAGKATLAGIDSDNDGVRDDVQRWIAINYPHSEKTRAALRQLAIARQNFILSASDANAAYDNAIQMGRGSDCLFHLRPVHWYDDSVALEAVILNTAARSREYLKANHLLSGRSFGLLFDPVQGCDFNPTLMAN